MALAKLLGSTVRWATFGPGNGFVLVTCRPGSPPQSASKPQPWVASRGNSPPPPQALLVQPNLGHPATPFLSLVSSNKCLLEQSRAGDTGAGAPCAGVQGGRGGCSIAPPAAFPEAPCTSYLPASPTVLTPWPALHGQIKVRPLRRKGPKVGGGTTSCHLGAPGSHWRKDGVTHRILDSREVHICLLEPVIEVLSIVSGVTLAVGGHTEHCQGVLYFWQAAQVGLER